MGAGRGEGGPRVWTGVGVGCGSSVSELAVSYLKKKSYRATAGHNRTQTVAVFFCCCCCCLLLMLSLSLFDCLFAVAEL